MIPVEFSNLKGQIFEKVTATDDSIIFVQNGKTKYVLEHLQDCCESVTLDDICGNLSDLENTPILVAEEVTSEDLPPKDRYDDSYTWTFYKLATEKGWVDIKFYGTSNGYYSESADLCEYGEHY